MIVCSVLASIVLGVPAAWATECEQNIEDWLAANNARVIAFLRALPPGAVGSTVPGVKLSDGRRVLTRHKYLGQVIDPGAGAHVYLFSDRGKRVAYVWVDASGAPLPVPECETRPTDDEPKNVLSGDVYTFKDVQPGDGIVVFHCGNVSAWRGWVPNKPLQPTRAASH